MADTFYLFIYLFFFFFLGGGGDCSPSDSGYFLRLSDLNLP